MYFHHTSVFDSEADFLSHGMIILSRLERLDAVTAVEYKDVCLVGRDAAFRCSVQASVGSVSDVATFCKYCSVLALVSPAQAASILIACIPEKDGKESEWFRLIERLESSLPGEIPHLVGIYMDRDLRAEMRLLLLFSHQ